MQASVVTNYYCQALVPSPVVLDPIPNQSQILKSSHMGHHPPHPTARQRDQEHGVVLHVEGEGYQPSITSKSWSKKVPKGLRMTPLPIFAGVRNLETHVAENISGESLSPRISFIIEPKLRITRVSSIILTSSSLTALVRRSLQRFLENVWTTAPTFWEIISSSTSSYLRLCFRAGSYKWLWPFIYLLHSAINLTD